MSTEERPIKYNRFNIMVERKTVIVEEVCVSVDVPTFIKDTIIRQGYAEELVRSKAAELEWTTKNKQDSYDIRDNMLVTEADTNPPNIFVDGEEEVTEMREVGIQKVDVATGQCTWRATNGKLHILTVSSVTASKIENWMRLDDVELKDAVPELSEQDIQKLAWGIPE